MVYPITQKFFPELISKAEKNRPRANIKAPDLLKFFGNSP